MCPRIYWSTQKKAPVITDDVKIFLAQVDQFLEMIEMSIDSPSGNHIINRAANGLRNAAKFIGFNDLTELAENFAKKSICRSGLSERAG